MKNKYRFKHRGFYYRHHKFNKIQECIRRASVTAFNIEYSKEALKKIYGIKTR